MAEFIESLPGGFNTMIGEHGATLSGGQRQRIAIARALYNNPEILVLDEATSSLDPISEEKIQNALMQFRMAGKTLIVIAHRLSTISRADIIYVLHKGQVSESGTFNELVKADGIFMQMLQHQNLVINHQHEKQNTLVL
jgi:ATP-binding cassette subfamily B protein